MNYSPKGLALTKEFEGLRLRAYKDGGGVWTIGYGHTRGVTPDMFITQAAAELTLMTDMIWAEHSVNTLVTVPLTQDQFDALVDFVYNVGEIAFKNSTLLKLLNSGNYDGTCEAFLDWKYDNHIEVDGLLRRREAEAALFKGN